jgi:hypothetical protein
MGRKVWNSTENILHGLSFYAVLMRLQRAFWRCLSWKDRARFYSYLHRVWSKTSDKPVWMDQAEKATGDFY